MPRTDLAEEIAENTRKTEEKIYESKEIIVKKREEEKGEYITVYFPFPFSEKQGEKIEKIICKALFELLPEGVKNIIVAGIGNHSITADSIGPASAENIIATRGVESIKKQVSVIRPEVEAKTGIKTAEYIKTIAQKIKPDAVILIDSLASKSLDRLFKTIQITNTGISPGSGLGQRNERISEQELLIPVISIGVPTVVDVNTLTFELTGKEIKKEMVVTPTNADYFVYEVSKIIARGVNLFNFGEL